MSGFSAQNGRDGTRFIDGRTNLIGWGRDNPLVRMPASRFQGAVVYNAGEVWWSDGVTWRSTNETLRFLGTAEDITVEVLAGGTPNNETTFASVADALGYLARFRPDTSGEGDPGELPIRTGRIIIKSGHVVQDQVLIDGLSMGWLQIESEDAVVEVDRASMVNVDPLIGTNSRPLFSIRHNGTAPRIKTMFELNTTGSGTPEYVGMRLFGGAVYKDEPDDAAFPALHGFGGFFDGFVADSGCILDVWRKTITNSGNNGIRCTRASKGVIRACDVRGATVAAVSIQRGSIAHIAAVSGAPNTYRNDATGLVDSNNDIRVIWGGVIFIEGVILGGTNITPNQWVGGNATASGYIHRLSGPNIPAGIIRPDSFTVATVPSAAAYTGHVIYVSNGNSGAPCLAVSNGTNWLRIALGAAVST
jgi:hypothetical protein